MRNFLKLLAGELKRLVAYKILPISLATSLIWIIVFLFLSKKDAADIAPLLIFTDVTMMSVLLIGASFYLEKQEGTIKSMMVMPVSLGQILSAKIASSMVLGLESALVTSIGLYFIHGVTYNYAVLLFFVAIAGLAHAGIGFTITMLSKDFTTLLCLLMAYIFPFTIPSILITFGIIPVGYDWLLMLSPSHVANKLITFAVSGEFDLLKTVVGCAYLLLAAAGLIKFMVTPRFKKYSVKG